MDYTQFISAATQLAGTALIALLTWAAHAATQYIRSRNALAKQVIDSQQAAVVRAELADVAETVVRYTEQVFVAQLKEKSADGKLTAAEAKEAAYKAGDAAETMLRERGVQVGQDTLKYAIEAAVQKMGTQKKTTPPQLPWVPLPK